MLYFPRSHTQYTFYQRRLDGGQGKDVHLVAETCLRRSTAELQNPEHLVTNSLKLHRP